MDLVRYPEYKDSGIWWIGEIPKYWDYFKLKYVISQFIAGGTPKSDNESYWGENNSDNIPWVAINDMSNIDIVKSTSKSITSEGLHAKNLKILPTGTIIYSIFASLGKVSVLGIPAVTNQAILGLITNSNVNDKFLIYYLKFLEKYIPFFSNSNTQDNLNTEIVKNINIFLPSLTEQKQIANYLDNKIAKIDKTIKNNQNLIELLEEKRVALINQSVTKGLNPDVKMKDSGVEWIGNIPENWSIERLKFLTIGKAQYGANEEPEKNEGKCDYRYVRITDVGDCGFLKKDSIAYLSEEKALNFVLNEGDVLFARSGATVGKSYLYTPSDGCCCFAGYMIRYVANDTKLIPKFLLYYSLSNSYKEWIKLVSIQSTIENVSANKYDEMFLPIPPLTEQKQIANYLDNKIANLDKIKAKIKEQKNLLEEYKESLIYNVVTGKVDVRGEDI